MAGRRLLYAALLAAATLFQIFYYHYLARIVFLTVLGLPLLSLALSLPALLRLSLRLAPSAAEPARGEAAQWLVRAENPSGLPVARLRLTVKSENRMTGASETVRLELSGLSAGGLARLALDTAHCGCLDCAVTRLRGVDYLGLFSLPLRAPAPARALVLPPLGEAALPPALAGLLERQTPLPRPGGGPGEDYELRGYRPGDPLRSVHWKLSAKLGEPVVRETLEARRPDIVLRYAHHGAPERLDAALARLYATSVALLEAGLPHRLCWTEPDGGLPRGGEIGDRRALLFLLSELLACPAAEEAADAAPPAAPAGSFCVEIGAGAEAQL